MNENNKYALLSPNKNSEESANDFKVIVATRKIDRVLNKLADFIQSNYDDILYLNKTSFSDVFYEMIHWDITKSAHPITIHRKFADIIASTIQELKAIEKQYKLGIGDTETDELIAKELKKLL